MAIVSIVFSIIIAVLFLKITKNIYNAATIFCGYWGILVFLNYLSLDGMHKPSELTYSYIFLGIFGFTIGCILALLRTKRINVKVRKGEPNYFLLKIACVIIIAYCLYRISLIVVFLAQGYSWGEIRLMHGIAGDSGEGTLKGGTFSQILHDWCVAPLLYLLAPTLVIDLFIGKREKQFSIMAIVAMILYSVSTVSRAIWSFLILYAICVMIICKGKYQLPKKVKKWIRRIPIFIVILFLIIVFITQQRSADSEANIILNMYAYLAGGISLMDIYLQSPISNMCTYGFFSMYGFVQPIFFVLNYLHILDYPQAILDTIQIKDALEVYIPISDHITMNAYSTLFYNFYLDFRIVGIFIGSMIFGLICMKMYRNFKQRQDFKSLAIYLILVQFIIFSMARIYTSLTTRALTFIWILFMFRNSLDGGLNISGEKRGE